MRPKKEGSGPRKKHKTKAKKPKPCPSIGPLAFCLACPDLSVPCLSPNKLISFRIALLLHVLLLLAVAGGVWWHSKKHTKSAHCADKIAQRDVYLSSKRV